MKHTVDIIRKVMDKDHTLGDLFVFKNGEFHFSCVTLELPWKENQRNISCIPPGGYSAHKHRSPKFGACIKIKDVKDRDHILIHPANYTSELRGCVAVGRKHVDLNNDSINDVYESRNTFNKLMLSLPSTFELRITNAHA